MDGPELRPRGSHKVASIWVTVSSTWSSDRISLSNGIEDIERGKSQAKAPIKSHYGPVWCAQGSAGHLMTTTGTVSAAHKTRCPDCSTGAILMVVRAPHVAYQQQKSPPGLRHKPEFIWLSLKRTNNVARWYKITRSIMVIIMPFIKIGQLSQHLASIGGSCRRGSWHSLVPYIFSALFYQGLLSVIWRT